MKKCFLVLLFFIFIKSHSIAQVGIGTPTPNSSAKLDISSTSQGVLFPRMTASQREAIVNPAQGLFVFQTNGTIGLYYFDGSNWRNNRTGFIPDANGASGYININVSTIAGSIQGFADGNVSSAKFFGPTGVATDANGNIYVADANNHKIRKIDLLGNVTTIAGSVFGFADGNGAAAKFAFPQSVATDVNGNLYVVDKGNQRIRKIDPLGNVTTLAGNSSFGFADGNGTAAQFRDPMGIATDIGGNVYVADMTNQMIRKIDPLGNVTTLAGSVEGFADGNGSSAKFDFPSGVATDANGNVYVADQGNHRIRKIDPLGNVTTLAGSGTPGFLNGNGGSAQFTSPRNVATDANGNVYVANNEKIRKIDPLGNVTTLAGTIQGFADGNVSLAKFSNVEGIVTDASGNVYVADQFNNRIRKIVF